MAAWALYRVTFRPLLAQANTPFHLRTGMSHLTRDKEELRERERKSNERVVEQADFLDLYPPNGFLSQLRRKRCGKL
jgi:hypothetical protein